MKSPETFRSKSTLGQPHKSFDSLSEEERAKKFLKYFNLRKGGQFHCLIRGCGKMFFVGSSALMYHFREEYNVKEGGENNMSKKANTNAWVYEEVEAILRGAHGQETEGQLKNRLSGRRSTDAIKATLSKFYNFQEGRNLGDISKPLTAHFTLFIEKNADTVPTRPVLVVEPKQQEVETEAEVEVEETEEEKESLETATTFDSLNQWFKDGGPIIMAHVKAMVAEEVEQIKAESIKRLKDQQKELDRLREVEKKYEKAKQAFA